MIQRLTNTFMPPADLRRLMGDEAYEAAKKLGAIQMEEDRKAKIYDDFYQEFGPALQEKEAAAQWKLTMAYQEFGKQQREALAKIALIEQEKEKAEQEKEKAEQEKEKAKQAVEEARALAAQEKQEKKDAILAAKKEKLEALKIQKKAEQALKKALKAEEHQKQLVLIQKMLKKGETVAEIADLLDVNIPQLQKWIHKLKK